MSGSRDRLTADEFFGLVEEHLVRPMARLGYHRIHASVNTDPESRGRNTLTGGSIDADPFLWFHYGFEAESGDVMRLMDPDDPDSESEWWVNYEPSTGTLELGDWLPVAEGAVGWDIWRDQGPCTRAEVERRLAAVGASVLAFARET